METIFPREIFLLILSYLPNVELLRLEDIDSSIKKLSQRESLKIYYACLEIISETNTWQNFSNCSAHPAA